MIELRDYQREADADLADAIRRGVRRVVFVSPTGSGKGTLAAWWLAHEAAQGRRALFLVHRREIILDVYDRVKNAMGCASVGAILASAKHLRNDYASVQIASIASLRDRILPDADLVVFDEAHRAKSQSAQALMEEYPRATIVGLTATPLRLDRQGLGDVFDELHIIAQPSRLIAAGHIVAPVVYTVPSDMLPNLSDTKLTGGDYDAQALGHAMDKRHLVGNLREHWQERAEGRSTVVFAVHRTHAKHICEEFVAAGIAAEYLDGDTPTAKRTDTIARFAAGAFRVMVQCQLFVEGVDIPRIKCVVLARPTRSVTMMLQSVGRALRPWEGVTPIVLDHAGNVLLLDHPSDDREWSLDATRPSVGRGAPQKTCPGNPPADPCFQTIAASFKVCPHCGHAFTGNPDDDIDASIRTLDGRLVEFRPRTPEQQQAYAWKQLVERARDRGENRGWIEAQFVQKFGARAPASFAVPPVDPRRHSDDHKARALRELQRIAHHERYGPRWIGEKYFNKFGESPPRLGERHAEAAPLVAAAPSVPELADPTEAFVEEAL